MKFRVPFGVVRLVLKLKVCSFQTVVVFGRGTKLLNVLQETHTYRHIVLGNKSFQSFERSFPWIVLLSLQAMTIASIES